MISTERATEPVRYSYVSRNAQREPLDDQERQPLIDRVELEGGVELHIPHGREHVHSGSALLGALQGHPQQT